MIPMRPVRTYRTTALAFALALGLACAPAHALLNIGGTRNQVFVFGRAGVAHDSNIFSDATEQADTTFTASAGAELTRRRGIIGVNAAVTLDYVRFERFRRESGLHPDFKLGFTKSTGRTTGELNIRAYRANRADSAVNLRTTTWNVPLDLTVRYPVNEKLYLASASGYLRRDYRENDALVDSRDYSQAIDLFYVYNSRLDLVAGYRFRQGETSLGRTRDHSLTAGATGGLLPKVSGTVRLGYQARAMAGGADQDQFTVSAALNWVPTRKLSFALQASRDFTLTALGDSVDTFGASLNATYAFNRRFDVETAVAYGRNRFLGAQRTDDFFEWTLSGRYTLNEQFTVSGAYRQLRNWSTITFSDFDRALYSLDVSSRF